MSGNLPKLALISLIALAAVTCNPVTNVNSTVPGLPSAPAAQSAPASGAYDDVTIGDRNTDYMAIEFSPDMRYMTWIEPAGGISLSGTSKGADKTVWLCAMDAASGEMIPPSGKGFKIVAVSNFGGSPQWGHDDHGAYLAMVDHEGYIVIARPEMQPGNTLTATVNRLPTEPNPSRTFAYPSRIREAGGFIAYIQKDAQGEVQLHYLDLAHPRDEHQITRGPQVKISKAQIPPFLVDVQRWFYDVETLIDGLPVIVYGDAEPGKTPTMIEIKQVDLSVADPKPVVAATSTPVLFDPWPFLYENKRYILAGIQFSSRGAVFSCDESGQYRKSVNNLSPGKSTLKNPVNFSSCEPFIWQGKVYTAFQVNEPGFPGSTPAEIWLASVFDNSVLKRISGDTISSRADPEFFLGKNSVWIFYYGHTGDSNRWELHRADTGLRR